MTTIPTIPLFSGGPEVARLCLGTMMFADRTDEAEAARMLDRYFEAGGNFIDTADFYTAGQSETILGELLKEAGIRDRVVLTSKFTNSMYPGDPNGGGNGRKHMMRALDASLRRLGTDYLDVILLHDVEFVDLPQIWEETIPAALELKKKGLVRAVGFSCYPMKSFHTVLDHAEDDLDCILSYNEYTLQNTTLADSLLPRLVEKKIGIMNAGPFSARLLTNAPLPEWLKEPEEVKAAARAAAKLCDDQGVDIAQLALQFSCAHQEIATCVAGSANPDNVRKWAQWLEKPIPEDLLAEVLKIFEPVKNIGHAEGLPENN